MLMMMMMMIDVDWHCDEVHIHFSFMRNFACLPHYAEA